MIACRLVTAAFQGAIVAVVYLDERRLVNLGQHQPSAFSSQLSATETRAFLIDLLLGLKADR